jgi:hypothetical protein
MCGKTITLEPEEIDFKTNGVQFNFFVGHKIIGEYLIIEAGPLVQINSKLFLMKDRENAMVKDYDLVAESLEDISRDEFQPSPPGCPGDYAKIKFWIQYQYGFSNIFNTWIMLS